MRPRLATRLKRLEQLAREKQANASGRWATVVLGEAEGETHLEMTYSGANGCCFELKPGPGPQLSNFGQFASVLYLTEDEANI